MVSKVLSTCIFKLYDLQHSSSLSQAHTEPSLSLYSTGKRHWVATFLLGKELEDFDESYPHCLQASEQPKTPTNIEMVALEQLKWIEFLRL